MKHWIWPACAVLSLSCASAPPKKPPASQALSTTCASDARAATGSFTPNSISVVVRGPSGTPAAGVTVRFSLSRQEVAQGVTDAAGLHQGVLEPGVYAVQVESEGRALAVEGISLERGCAVSLTLARP